ncbi:MAG: alpha/beta hydrolase [Bifidobacteriaceae bacterium]|jgi:pimeloyl-ACP methyl ester carboxylesterase|nr:alpha/beta hydrolase [Bifidobacteriaceae bacterium]
MTLSVHPRGTLSAGNFDYGRTVPLVLLHAFPLDHRMWEPVAAQLADLPVLLVDLPGAGMSPVVAPTLEAAAGELAGTLTALGYTRWAVGGCSLGGYVALALARLYPDALAGLALIDTKASADDDAVRVARHDVAREVLAAGSAASVIGMADVLVGTAARTKRPELVDEVGSWIASSTPAGLAWAEAAMASRPDSSGTLMRLSCPACVVVGEDDQFSPPGVARLMAAAIPGAVLTVVPRAGHLSPVEGPAPVAGALRALMARVSVS